MGTYKHYLNKEKTKFDWRTLVKLETGILTKNGKPIKKPKHLCYTKTKSEGEDEERKFWIDYSAGKIELNKDITLGTLTNSFNDYMENEGNYSEGCIANYKGYCNNHLSSLLPLPMKNLSKQVIQMWEREMHIKGASPHIYNGCIKYLKAVANYGIRLDIIKVNPFEHLKSKSIPPKLRNRFGIDKLKLIIDICRNQLPEYHCLFILGIMTGARLGEYSALRPLDIDFDSCEITINKQITRGKEKNRTKVNASTRVVKASPKVLETIKWHIDTYNIQPNEHMFKTSSGGLIYAKWVERKFEKLLELAGYDKKYCRVHDLRGQYVDMMHLCHVPVTYISRQVGHSNSYITERAYTQILKELPEEANARMDNMLFGTSDSNDNKEE